LSENSLFIKACKRQKTERTPVWIMRQAGRYLPEYRAIREKHDFLTMCKTPELASEVTVQPIDIIETDAAILFSDILVIPEAMGMHLDVIESKGPVFDEPIRSAGQIENLKTDGFLERLDYVMQAVKMTKEKLTGRVPLIGFSGSPWTLAAYMVEGKGSKNFDVIKSFVYKEPEAAHRLLQLLADSVVEYLNAKIRAGCDAVQIFDTWASILSPHDFEEYSLTGCETSATCAGKSTARKRYRVISTRLCCLRRKKKFARKPKEFSGVTARARDIFSISDTASRRKPRLKTSSILSNASKS
jgi:uroporphyrinogen decarboxylase